MAMGKKQFIELADMIRDNRAEFSDKAVLILALFCAGQNPAFKKDRWYGYIKGTCGPNGGAR